jgi:hypothetical protein
MGMFVQRHLSLVGGLDQIIVVGRAGQSPSQIYHLVSANSSRPINMRRISDVPAPIS